MNYWIFKCNPELYRICDRLKNPDPNTTWKVTRYKGNIQIGDKAFIYQTGKLRGFCAVMDIVSNPCEMDEIEIEKIYYLSGDFESKLRVKGLFTSRFSLVEPKLLKQIPGLEKLSLFHGFQQGTNFPVKQKEAEILLKLFDGFCS